MAKLVEFNVGEDDTILVEVEDVESDGIKPASKRPGEMAIKAGKSISEALSSVGPMIKDIKHRLDEATEPADEVEVKFSVKLSGEVDAVLTRVGGEATYEITLKWQHK